MRKLLFFIWLPMIATYSNAQDKIYNPKEEKLNIGLGAGMDYGGLGINILYYPQKNVGIFAGGGATIPGLGYHAGLKGRIFLNETSSITPFIMAMYGRISTETVGKNKYRPSFGGGIDWRVGKTKRNYLSIGVTYSSLYEGYDYTAERDLIYSQGKGFVFPSVGYRCRIK